jgi:nucleoside-diphosphate-sugar epimerase
MISIFGSSGFIGSRFISMYNDKCIIIEKSQNTPKTNNILYFISTVDNYNVYTDPYLDINTNLIKLISVLEECKKINEKTPVTFNFISSWFVYGKTNDFPAKETSICDPTGFYSITKYAAEKMLVSYCNTFNIKYRILRLTNIIGNNDKKISKKKNAIQYLINKLKNNEDIELYNNGNVVRDYMFVDDCCRAINTCIERANYNEIINISNSEPAFIKDIIYYAKEKLKSSSKIISIETPEFHKNVQIENIYLDNTKLINLQYTPQTTVYQAIDKILET